jgi:NADPH-dependent glutamate synthase beta subunit-like oxidoreductase
MTSDVYNINRIDPGAAPEGSRDDTALSHFVPAPCQVACPIGTDAPSYIGYIWENKIEEAFEAITATNPFSSICGRVCDAPCEPACRRADSDGPIAIRNLKRYVMEQLGKDHRLPVVEVSQKKTVAIVGGGPAGMTAAQDLAEAGYEVHVYEMTDRLGGMMIWGIPTFRLPAGTIAEDMDRMLAHCPGIKVHLNTPLGTEMGDGGVTLEELKEKHDAVLLSIGAWWGKSMKVDGDDDERVVDGVGFLRRVNNGERPRMPSVVTVIGGGDVAMDACRAAARLPGCEKVKVVYRRGPEEIPARKDELEGAIKEDIDIIYNEQPVAVVPDGDGLKLRCIKTEMGEPDDDGRRRPVEIAGSEHDIDCGLVIMAVGQQTESEHLESHGLMNRDRVQTDWNSMRTPDEKVFAAGDGAFGGSTIVMAMQHGHRSAYYIKAFLEGRENPVTYRTPFRTRDVPVAQDAEWELFAREEQEFHGLGEDPISFPEIESTYTPRSAKCEAARCYRCDVETGAQDYSVKNREDIFVMARTAPEDARTQRAILNKRIQPRENPFPDGGVAAFDDLVFLPANLSRLVIDPYRDDCNVITKIGGDLRLESPSIVAGLDDAADEVRADIAAGVASHGSAYIGRRALSSDVPWVQLLGVGDTPDSAAVGYIAADPNVDLTEIKAAAGVDKFTGMVFTSNGLEASIIKALDAGLDVALLDGTSGILNPWSELSVGCDLELLRDTIAIMRGMNREEDLDILYFGGLRSGTDVAKALSLGCNAGVLGMSIAMAAGGTIEDGSVAFYSDFTSEDRTSGVEQILQATSGEASIMARCTGKTNVHNLEPEDLRSITITTARAAGIPLAGTNRILEAAE